MPLWQWYSMTAAQTDSGSHLPTLGHGAVYSTFLCLSFLICKMGVTQACCEDEMN